MKKIIFLMCFLMMFSSTVLASPYQSKSITENEVVVEMKYFDYDGKEAKVSIKDKILNVNAHPFIRLYAFEDLVFEAEKFVFLITHARYEGYVMLNHVGNNKIRMYVDEREYTIVNNDWETVDVNKFDETPFYKDDIPYIPLKTIELLGYTYSISDDKIVIDMTKKYSEQAKIKGYNKKLETIIVTENGVDKNYRLIGVNLPDDDKIFNKYTKKYLDSLKNKYVTISTDESVGKVYNKQKDFYYAYLTLQNEKISINEKMIKEGYGWYFSYNVDSNHIKDFNKAYDYAVSNQLGVYHEKYNDNDKKLKEEYDKSIEVESKLKSNQFKIVDAYEKTKYIESHGLGRTEIVESKIILEQNGKTYTANFLSEDVPELMREYSSLAIKTINEKYKGDIITLRVTPKTNYEFVLYILDYLLNNKK
jgi:Staphylococcal nuclease homologue.